MKSSHKSETSYYFSLATILFSVLTAMGSAIAQNEPISLDLQKKQLCTEKGINPKSAACLDQIKQSQLKVIKLSPKIRAVNIEQDHGVNLIEFYPFIGGYTGQVE